MYFKKSFYGLIKYRKKHSTQSGVDRNPTDISIWNFEFSYFRGFRNRGAYGAACKDSEAKSQSQRSDTVCILAFRTPNHTRIDAGAGPPL